MIFKILHNTLLRKHVIGYNENEQVIMVLWVSCTILAKDEEMKTKTGKEMKDIKSAFIYQNYYILLGHISYIFL